LLPATCAPKAAEHKHQKQLAALLLLLVSRLTTKSTCRQQNTMPLKDEQVPELHGKMPNSTSETVEKLLLSSEVLLLLLVATATCYLQLCTKSSCRQQATLPLLLVDRTSNKSTCRQQNTMPLKDEQVPELHGKMA